jgi:tellurite resistance protein TerB
MAPQNARRPSPMSPGQLRQAHHTYLEEMLFEAVVTAGAVVALADGHVDPEERARVVDLVERSGWLSTYTAAEAEDAFDSQVRQLEMEDGIPETALNSVRRVGDGLGSRVVVCAAEEVASADGQIQPHEEEAIGLVRSALAPSTEQAGRSR